MNDQRLIVGFYPETTGAERKEIHNLLGAQVVQVIDQLHAEVIVVPIQKVKATTEHYAANYKVRYIEKDHVVKATGCRSIVPNDPNFDLQWGLEKIQAPEAWCKAVLDPAGIAIAILDTGIDPEHPDLAEKVTKSVNLTSSPTANDEYGHGTHVAGIAGAITDNLLYGAGMSFNTAELWNYKVLADDGFGFDSWVAQGIVDAADDGAAVINLSLGGYFPSQVEEDAVNYAWNKGVVIVAAAGNDNTDFPFYPSSYENTISVAATNENDQKADFSNFGANVDIAAPGVNIFSTCPTHPNVIGCLNFGALSGTSMATPFVAGLAALIKATFPGLNNESIRFAIESSTDTVPGTGTLYRFGRINANSAILKAGTL